MPEYSRILYGVVFKKIRVGNSRGSGGWLGSIRKELDRSESCSMSTREGLSAKSWESNLPGTLALLRMQVVFCKEHIPGYLQPVALARRAARRLGVRIDVSGELNIRIMLVDENPYSTTRDKADGLQISQAKCFKPYSQN